MQIFYENYHTTIYTSLVISLIIIIFIQRYIGIIASSTIVLVSNFFILSYLLSVPRFWSYQPVAHFNMNKGVIDPESSYRTKPYIVRCIDDSIITKSTLNIDVDLVIAFIKHNFYVEKDNVYSPTTDDIMNWLQNDGTSKISFYYRNDTLCGIMTTQDVDVIVDDSCFKCNYVDWLCVNKDTRKSGVAQKLIQTHESRLPVGAVSLFKLDSKMDLTNIPITSFETKCYKIKHTYNNKDSSTLTEDVYTKHLDFWKKYYDFICVPSYSKINTLIRDGQLIHINGFYFKKSCMYLHNELCYTLIAIVNTPSLKDFHKAVEYLPENIYICIESLGWCNEIINELDEPLYKSYAGLYFYNYYTESINKNKVVAII
jgi:hypothetical protein